MDGAKKASVLGSIRLPFLILTPACVALGVATALWSGSEPSLFHVLLVLIGAIAAHIAVNAINEYHDFKSGLDFHTQRTPFSGGSGTLPSSPEKAHLALVIGLIALVIVGLIGLYFLVVRGLALLPLGILGVLVIVAYTKWLTRSPLLCLIAPGLGFGTLMVMGTDLVLTGSYSWISFVASLVPFFLVSDLLLLNQFPDVEADQEVGRRHLPIAIGRKASAWVYGALLAGAYGTVLVSYFLGLVPLGALLALGSAILAVPTAIGVARYADEIPRLVPYMVRNVIIVVLTPALFAVGLFIAL